MSRRGRVSQAAVSLFSFQDIITSVTAIMILLVLILTLELLERSERRGVAAADREVAKELLEAIQALEAEAQVLQSDLATLQASALEASSFSESDTRRVTAERRETAARLREEIEAVATKLRLANAARRRAEEETITERSRDQGSSITDVQAIAARAEEIERANRIERDRQAAANEEANSTTPVPTLVFNMPPDGTLQPRLVVVSEDGLMTLATGSSPAHTFPSLGSAFQKWLVSLDAQSEYVVILLRPSGIPLYRGVLDAVQAAGLGVGSELIGESMPVAVRNEG